MAQHIAYYRVSTQKQGRSGLGLEAQREAVLAHTGGRLLGEFVEVESGRNCQRPQLAAALQLARATGAVLIVAKLDRLARDVAFTAALMNAGVELLALDFPQANRLTLHIVAAMAEHEAHLISARTRAALAAAKARGTRLGNPNGAAALRRAGKGNVAAVAAVKAAAEARVSVLAAMVRDIQRTVTTLSGIAAELQNRGARTARGGQWTATQVSRLLARLPA